MQHTALKYVLQPELSTVTVWWNYFNNVSWQFTTSKDKTCGVRSEKRASFSVSLPLNQSFLSALSFCHFLLLILNPQRPFQLPTDSPSSPSDISALLPAQSLFLYAQVPASWPFLLPSTSTLLLSATHALKAKPPKCFTLQWTTSSCFCHPQALINICWQLWKNLEVPRRGMDAIKTEMGPMGAGSAWGRWNPIAIAC